MVTTIFPASYFIANLFSHVLYRVYHRTAVVSLYFHAEAQEVAFFYWNNAATFSCESEFHTRLYVYNSNTDIINNETSPLIYSRKNRSRWQSSVSSSIFCFDVIVSSSRFSMAI